MRRAVIALVLLGLGVGVAGCATTPNAGEMGVTRSGKGLMPWSWFNGHNIKGVVKPGAGYTYTGFGSSTHYYPADTVQRTYTISTDKSKGDVPGYDIVEVPTADSVQVGINGTFYFTTAFNASKQGVALVKDFDNRFGVRTFTSNNPGQGELHAWEGTDGWSDFLDQVIRPVINNDLRASISQVQCSQLVSSCALVHQQTNIANVNNNANIQKIQDTINSNLQTDIKAVLGQDYFSHITFLLGKVVLPNQVQTEINNAQAQYAAVASATAKVQQQHQEALANAEREKGFRACPACAQAAVLAAIPGNVTTFAPGGNFAVTK